MLTAPGCWRLSVTQGFSAAHALRHYEGKCERLHGHNFQVEVQVEGRELQPGTELLLDFKILKTELKAVLESLDHHDLNETPPFNQCNPSSEQIGRYIYEQLAPRLRSWPVRISSVTVGEKPGQSATFLPD